MNDVASPTYRRPEVSDVAVMNCMRVLGGSFIRALAMAAYVADSDNLALIKEVWAEDWAAYKELARKRQQVDAECIERSQQP